MEAQTKPKRRWGDRYDGRRLRSLDPINAVMPFIMKTRSGAANYFFSKEDIRNAERYIRRKRVEGLKGFGLFHFFLAVYVRIVSQRPGINRFIAGRRVYARNSIDINFVVKKEMKLDAQETTVKVTCLPTDTAEDIFNRVQAAVALAQQEGDSTGVDDTARILRFIPRPFWPALSARSSGSITTVGCQNL